MRLFSKRIEANIFDLKKSVRDNLQTFKPLFYLKKNSWDIELYMNHI